MEITLPDGLRDNITDEGFTLPNANAEPARMRFKVKEGVTTASIKSFTRYNSLSAVDWGLNEPLDHNPVDGHACGTEVTLFLRPNSAGAFGEQSQTYLYENELSEFLSQIDTLHDPFPEWFGYSLRHDLSIQSPEFKAPKGLFGNVQLTPFFAGGDNIGPASTFTLAPRIWSNLEEVQSFPANWRLFGGFNSTYEPFKNCENVEMIDNQGSFGDALEIIYPCNFTFYDSLGMGNPSAYPDGGRPKLINNYLKMDTYSFDSGYGFPQFDCSRLEKAVRPWEVKELFIGVHPGTSGNAPIGINLNDAPILKYLSLTLPKIVIDSGNFTGDFYYGAKALGIIVPDSVEQAYGLYSINSIHVTEGEIEEEIDGVFNQYVYGSTASLPLTPAFAKTKINFRWGAALETLFDPDEELITPTPSANLTVVSDYATNRSGDNPNSFVSKKLGEWKYYSPLPLPEGVEIIGSYCKNLYRTQTLGDGAILDTSVEGETLTVSGDVVIPRLPASSRIVGSFIQGTFSRTRGYSELEYVTAGEADLQAFMFAGKPASTTASGVGMHAFASYIPVKMGRIEREYAVKNGKPEDEGDELLLLRILEAAGEWQNSYTTNILNGGVIIETGPLPNLEYAIDWQKECWFQSTIDPTKFPTLLVPLPSSTKSENAYERALAIRVPSTPSKLTSFDDHTYGSKPSLFPGAEDVICDSPEDYRTRYFSIVVYKNPMAPADLERYRWRLEDISLPDFTIYNDPSVTYNAMHGLFEGIYGLWDDFFDKYIVDESITESLQRKDYLGLMDGSEVDPKAFPKAWFGVTYDDKLKQMSAAGESFVEKYLSIPMISENLTMGERPEDQDELYAYRRKFVAINNNPNIPSTVVNVSDTYQMDGFSQLSIDWCNNNFII